jgi:hypothetical protein
MWGDVVSPFHKLPRRLVVVALVQTQVLGRLLGRLGTLDHRRIQRGSEQLVVAQVRSRHHHRERSSVGLDQQGALHACLAPIGGVGAYEASKTRFANSPIGRLPLPSNALKLLPLLEEGSPDEIQNPKLNLLASRAARWSMRRRPVFSGGSCSAMIGSISSHSPSGVRQMVVSGFTSEVRLVTGSSSVPGTMDDQAT